MSDPSPGSASSAFTGPFGAVEPNVVIAGIASAVGIWIAIVAFTNHPLVPQPAGARSWFVYAILVVVALLAVVVLGLLVEGLAWIVEYGATRRLWDERRTKGEKGLALGQATLAKRGDLYTWYMRATAHPPRAHWVAVQRWIWQSPLASHEFNRRRTRILVSRNTAVVILALTAALAIKAHELHRPVHPRPAVILLAGLTMSALLVIVWLLAHRAYHRAASEAFEMGHPGKG